jgi:hypothetical protein
VWHRVVLLPQINRAVNSEQNGASKFPVYAAVLVDEERGGAFVKQRPGVCTGLLWGWRRRGLGNCGRNHGRSTFLLASRLAACRQRVSAQPVRMNPCAQMSELSWKGAGYHHWLECTLLKEALNLQIKFTCDIP